MDEKGRLSGIYDFEDALLSLNPSEEVLEYFRRADQLLNDRRISVHPLDYETKMFIRFPSIDGYMYCTVSMDVAKEIAEGIYAALPKMQRGFGEMKDG